ncbi:hypothetical protein AALP_AA8G067200 [Arabis alpina]|uniref:BZIP domain-containing protein n=1 Tax=Arabis alpina TaxID=50452 RepID=A0A087G5F8_ARAAL|nr:hypothetical protein AALP_AA8G067200 [Arabis alpina]
MFRSCLPVPASLQVSNGGNQSEENKVDYFNYELEVDFNVGQDIDPNMDHKKLKRIILNRVSAQRSRWKKRQYAEYLAKKLKELQMEVSLMRARFEMLYEKTKRLKFEHMKLQERVFATNQNFLGEGESEAFMMKLKKAGDEIGALELDIHMHLIL